MTERSRAPHAPGRRALAAVAALTALLAAVAAAPGAAARPLPAARPADAPVRLPPAAAPAAPSWLPATPAGWPQVLDYTRTRADTVTRGVTHYSETYDTLGGRQHTQVLSVDLADPHVRVGVVQAGDVVTDPADETVSSMAGRTHAVAGVNGDYFEIHGTGRPLGGVISDGRLMKTPRPGFAAQLGVRPDGSIVMGPQTFSGTLGDGTARHALTSVNTVADLAAGGITEATPYLGAATGLPSATVVLGHRAGTGAIGVDSVRTGVTSLDRLAAGRTALLGAGAGGRWLADTVHPGDTVTTATSIAPDDDLTQLISGVTMLVEDGRVHDDPTGTPPTGTNPETAVGVSRDGRHALLVTLDGRAGKATAFGVTAAQVAGYLVAHGAYTAELFDGGGSTEMVTRRPGDRAVSVAGTPSDTGNAERPVGDGVFVYATAARPGPPARVVIGGGRPVTTVPGGSIPVPVYATDRLGGPATGTPRVRVEPASLAGWRDGRLTPSRAGTGRIVARDGGVTASQPLRVVDRLATLTLAPNAPDLPAGATQAFTLAGTTRDGVAAAVPADAAAWRSGRPGLGTFDAHGVFTASATGTGLDPVTAEAAGARATASVAVGDLARAVDPVDDPATWRLSANSTGEPATLAADPGAVPPGSTASGSLRLDYTMPAGSGVRQLELTATKPLRVGPDADGRQPAGTGLWVRGDAGGLELAESCVGADGARTTLYPTHVTWHGWRLAVALLPPGLAFPLTVGHLDLLAVGPGPRTAGSLDVSGLLALYPPRPRPAPAPSTPLPASSWLRYDESAAAFAAGGATLLAAAGARLPAAGASPGGAALASVAQRLPTLPAVARPAQAQFLGDMSADGTGAALTAVATATAALGGTVHQAIGAGETDGAARDGDFARGFGAAPYAYTVGGAEVLVTDSARGGLLAPDPHRSPKQAQYPWLIDRLTRSTAPTVVLATARPAYPPDPAHGAGFTDAWEARMYVRLVQRWQNAHPGRHALMVYGGAGRFCERLIDPAGDTAGAAAGGVAQLTLPSLAPAAGGDGLSAVVLLHVSPRGTVGLTVEPVLSAITVTAPRTALTVGGHAAAVATGGQVTGGDVPLADPVAHVWSSGNPRVARVDPVTGRITARRPGRAVVTVAAGGLTGGATVSVR
ncbi:phosphodiester glycosidase family protein [Streptantibioticus silvisoli]|uniref:Phosphodiester glycosidase family protein n=1 Tax=Streptantibioticus silvisoli TaxID=2705255 RepID=A0ABT6VVU2_9ACTN|nr:phosphodiester glycosidase family protein [Streptantibioticus silvisoli]MDI5962606.1 phosphodiester glycosidase family protein [Streptantibioticus silvisoli]